MCNQANIYQQSAEKYIETIEKIHPKLVFVDNHIVVQLHVLDKMREYLESQTEACKNRIKVIKVKKEGKGYFYMKETKTDKF